MLFCLFVQPLLSFTDYTRMPCEAFEKCTSVPGTACAETPVDLPWLRDGGCDEGLSRPSLTRSRGGERAGTAGAERMVVNAGKLV